MWRVWKRLSWLWFWRPKAKPEKSVRALTLDGAAMDGWMPVVQGYPRADWEEIDGWIAGRVKSHSRSDAYTQCGLHWLNRIRGIIEVRAKNRCVVLESDNFLLLWPHSLRKGKRTLKLLEAADRSLMDLFGGNADAPQKGKLPVLHFAKESDYEQFIGYFYGHDMPPSHTMGGVYIHEGYPHIIMHGRPGMEMDAMLVHRLAHAMTDGFCLPMWVEEGIALVTEDLAMGGSPGGLSKSRRRAHLAYWSEQGLDSFWYGGIFGRDAPEQARMFAFELAEFLMRDLMARRQERLSHFLLNASQEDAGADAAEQCFHTTLGSLAGVLLGSGNWEPGRIRPR